MSYTALEEVRELNNKILGVDSPCVPDISENKGGDELCIEARNFIRNCENLGYDRRSRQEVDSDMQTYEDLLQKLKDAGTLPLRKEPDYPKHEKNDNLLHGKSISKCQIPYYAQCDFDRLTFENAIQRFYESGSKEDAFDVYFCYLTIFFGDYRDTRELIEMLCEFESNAGALLMKHRDHFAHSVYVFMIGLAVYQTNELYRNEYFNYYKTKMKKESRGTESEFDEGEARRHFLKFWGLTALFHDVGYAFELPFEQIKSYFSNSMSRRTARQIKDKFVATLPFIAYQNLDDYISKENINSKEKINQRDLNEKIRDFTGSKHDEPCDLTDILALHLSELFTKNEKYKRASHFVEYCKKHTDNKDMEYSKLYHEYLYDVLKMKPSSPDSFNGYMDHAYFSAMLLLHKLNEMKELKVDTDYTDALCAILLHNSLFKRNIVDLGDTSFAFTIQESPLAYLLMFCDELQCWDRLSYGINNRNAVFAMGCNFRFSNGKIDVTYLYDNNDSFKKRLEFYDWMRGAGFSDWKSKQTDGMEKSFKEFYEYFWNQDDEKYEFNYRKTPYKNGDFVYQYFKEQVDNPKADLPEKMNDYLQMTVEMKNGQTKFESDLKEILVLDGKDGIALSFSKAETDKPKEKNAYLSNSSYMHLYDFAVALNYRYNCRSKNEEMFMGASQKEMENAFEPLSLEYQISNVNQAKSFAKYLDRIGCFYTDRPVGYELVTQFEDKELEEIGKLEHQRWWNEKIRMGWTRGKGEYKYDYGVKNEEEGAEEKYLERKWVRECTHTHLGMTEIENISDEEKDKDKEPMNDMMKLLLEYDGIRVYRYRNNDLKSEEVE